MRDFAGYLDRVGLAPGAGLAEIHRAHVTAIPFENLEPHGGRPPSLAGEDLEAKLVGARRGGYCFEQNLLLAAALEELGAEVETILARVRFRAPAGAVRPLAHLILRVRLDGKVWHADVGFGMGTLLEPIPFGPGDEYEQSGWRYRVVDEDGVHVLQLAGAGDWEDVYAFDPRPAPRIDLEVANWFTGAHPRSPFVSGLIVAIRESDGHQVGLSDWSELALTESWPERSESTPIAREQVPALLAERFGLPGFALAEGGRIVVA